MRTATLTAKVNRWLHEHLVIKTPAKLLGGLALGALLMTAAVLPLGTTYADEPSRPLSSEQSQCYPEDVVLGWCYGFAATPDPALTTDATISGVQFEEWPEVGLDSVTYQRFMVEQGKVGSRLSSEQLQLIDDLEMMGFPWRIDHQGKVVVVETPRESVAATVIYRYDRSLDDEFMSDAPFFHTLNPGNAGSPPSINGIRCYPEDDC